MNLKLLKFSVIFMGILIILGIIILIIGIYKKINYIGSIEESKAKYLLRIEKPKSMQLKSHSFKGNKIIVKYENNSVIKLIIFDYIKDKKLKEIDLLK